MAVRLILIAVVVLLAVGGGLIFYGYSLAPTPKPVRVEIPNDQFPQ